jgi:hypothetical protein
VSHDTPIRVVRRHTPPVGAAPEVMGIDGVAVRSSFRD